MRQTGEGTRPRSRPAVDSSPPFWNNGGENCPFPQIETRFMKKTLTTLSCFAVLTLLPVATFAQISEAEKAEGFVSIFNGTDLTGWEGSPALWKVENGAIVGTTTAEGPAHISYNQFLIWKGVASDFVLRFDIKCSKAGNSGMQYRSWVNLDPEKPFSVSGYQADFDGEHKYSGILYGEGFRGILCMRGQVAVIGDDSKPKEVGRFAEHDALKKELKVEDWNSFEITAEGYTFTNKINGQLISICIDDDKANRRESGVIAIQAHRGPPMKVEVKNIRIKKL